MKIIGLYTQPSGSTIQLKLTPGANILTYVVFVDKFTEAGKVQEAIWHPEVLSSATGASLILQQVRGYRLNLQAAIKSGSSAKVDAELLFDGQKVFNEKVNLPKSEGPVVRRTWSIVVR